MNKRTNLHEKVFEYLIKSIIPVTLAFALVFGGFEPSLNRILSATVYMICPEKVFDFLKIQEQNINGTEEINKETLNNLETWFETYFEKQLIQSMWQIDFKVSHDEYFNCDYANIDELIKKADEVRKEIKSLVL